MFPCYAHILFSLICVTALSSCSGASKCGYSSCPKGKDGMLNVHLVPHTHDDVGWLKTVDQYFYGEKNNIQRAGVQYILDSVVQELLQDPSKRFIYVEIAFFARWLNEQNDIMRHAVKGLVNSGRLEFILGGWCMNDEATTHYNAIIDQHALGFEFLRQNFGECGRPRVAWQIDPFGHSREQASLFAQMGFDGLFFGRADYEDIDQRKKTKTMEMMWKGSPKNLGSKADLFTGVLFNGYGPPPGFCFDINCNDDPIQDDDRLHDYNVPQKTTQFIRYAELQAFHYATNNIIMTMGSDFNYQNAHTWFKNMDKLIKYVNQRQVNGSKVNAFYSTPSCYLQSLNNASKTWTTKQDDFFPYAHRPHSFWTGYFTSRPTLKGFVRQTNNFLQVCKQLDGLAELKDTDNSTFHLNILREALGVAQHHDAVSGTEKQAVAYDYAERLANGVMECQKVVNDALKKLYKKGSTPAPNQLFCNLLNISVCHVTENSKQFTLTVYNPLARSVISWIRLPVVGTNYTIRGPKGENLLSQVIQVSADTKRIPERKGSLAKNELVFRADLPPLGFNTYFISMTGFKDQHSTKSFKMKSNSDLVMKNEHVSLTFDGPTGSLKQITNLDSRVTVQVKQELMYYIGVSGSSKSSALNAQPSGAYIFRPNETVPLSFHADLKKTTVIKEGALVQEVYQKFSPWATQVIRLYDGAQHAEFEWTVGPIPVSDMIGKEVISRFSTDLATKGVVYTDANGREILQRKRNHRDTWNFTSKEPVSGNYYPVNSRIYLRDETKKVQFTVLTDRSQGGGSITDGNLELMVHRRLLWDDYLGVGEPLNETGMDGKGLIARGKHFIYVDKIDNSAKFHRDMALKLYMAPSLSFTTSTMKQSDWTKVYHTSWSGLKAALPDNVHMLTFVQWAGPSFTPRTSQPYLVRFEHIYEKDEDAELSKPVKIVLQNLFVPFDVQSVEELTLGANLQLSQLHRMQWKTNQHFPDLSRQSQPVTATDNFTVVLNPMEIRTFQITWK
ncbi:lysosomal alpha-mannosidase-like [Mytilus galloprovincialis]|uniref:lysosomal alpha-mannosidase-like n=1 Tax=Mytilus galloprovincialis TaxID=29158 RepID=UPI003F7BD571